MRGQCEVEKVCELVTDSGSNNICHLLKCNITLRQTAIR